MIVKDVFNNNESYTYANWVFRDVYTEFSRLYYIIDGVGYYEEGGNAHRFKKSHLYLTPTKRKFSLYDDPKDQLLHTYTHVYTLPAVSEFTEIEVVENTPLYDAVALWRKYINTDDKELLAGLVGLVLSCINPQEEASENAAKKTKEYIDKSNKIYISMNEISHNVGYSREHITRSFTLAYRMTPVQYMNSRKMKLALEILKENQNVGKTADILGYANLYSFSKAFKKHYGLSPKKYVNTFK